MPFIIEMAVSASGVVILGALYTTCGRCRLHRNTRSTPITVNYSAEIVTRRSIPG
jgi:hypothetical protein